ncbi:prolyl 4-hydroxylase subunit alpha-1-like isoform X4 [Dermacentor variabilis]|uniref:prolyl 4-hydroxylase subunit alpha-1-like isoform X4 n=1 Tax=Dermacentor variabilis TaxID=34621 RepID=UPI003F5C7500
MWTTQSRPRAAGVLMVIAVLLTLPLASAGQHQRDFYSSVANLLDLVDQEEEVSLMLLEYAERLKTLRSNIISFVETRQPYYDLETDSEVADYMKHPVHAFHLMKRMVVDLGSIESQINELHASDPRPDITEMRASRLLPWDDDFNGIALSLARLQDTYLLNMTNLVDGHLTITSGPRNRTVPGRISLTGLEWQTYGVPVRERNKKPLQFRTKLFTENLTIAQEDQNYKRLCRGEQLRTPKMDTQLRCRYFYGKGGFLRLQPVKIEEANLKPYIITFHDIIGDRDINDLIEFATPRLSRSTHFADDGIETSLIRTSSTAWLGDEDAPVATRLNRFLESLLGVGARYLKGEAEHYQIANYGVGGQFAAHIDYLDDILADPNRTIDDFGRTSGDRIATLMFYLSDVEEGGATVFPNLGVRLMPKKGNAAFWWNLNADGEGEQLTKHGGCPVLYGSKWIANKWFRSNSNMFRLPCSRNRSQPLGPLV